jgi:thiol-disulfide isomerase/thioredoxin
MDWPAALLAAVALPAGAVALGLWWRSRTGRVAAASDDSALDDLGLAPGALGSSATLVQFSTEYCSRCPSTARQLASIAADYAGVRHVELDLTRRPDLADRFRILQTPTTLILDAGGTASARIGGVPDAHAVRRHLDTLTGRSRVPS